MDRTLQTLLSSKYNDWHTPARYIEAARAVLGRIDLDPASSEQANKTIKANRYFDFAGLERNWYGTVWLNPPYGKTGGASNQGLWANKLIEVYERATVSEAVMLINFVPGYKWFSPVWAYPICAVDHCIRFERADGKPAGAAKASSCFVYFGLEKGKFMKEFSQFGAIVQASKQND